MFYIVNTHGQIVASASAPVNADELAKAGSMTVASELDLPPHLVRVEGFPGSPRIVEQPYVQPPMLALSTSAADDDGDGVPELKADGKASASITVTATDAGGEPVELPVPVTFRTTGGRLSARTAPLKHGTATVKLTASRETVLVHVTANAPGCLPGELDFELIP